MAKTVIATQPAPALTQSRGSFAGGPKPSKLSELIRAIDSVNAIT